MKHRRLRVGSLGWVLLVVVFFWIPLATGLHFTIGGDETAFHISNIRRFADHFPGLAEMRRTNLSMLPLFHGAMGALTRFTGSGTETLRLFMVLIGAGCLFLFMAAARSLGLNRLKAALGLVAFPYFGAAYFIVMTDYPAFLFFLLSMVCQLAYLKVRRSVYLWAALLAAMVACLIRQNLIYIAGVFAIAIFASSRLRRLGSSSSPMDARGKQALVRPYNLLAFVLPLSAILFQIWLWKGLLPPAYQVDPGYVAASPGTFTVSVISIAANLGYYLIPAIAILAWTERRQTSAKDWIITLATGLAGSCLTLVLWGRTLINTYGTFSHALLFLRLHCGGVPAAFGGLLLSLTSFTWIIRAAVLAFRKEPDGGFLLLLSLFGVGMGVVAFGLSRIYEHHLIPLAALLVLIFLRTIRPVPRRVADMTWAALVLFGFVNEIVYAVNVYFRQ